MKPTYRIAMAAGQDAGNRAAKAAGRTAWNHEDWNAAASVVAEIIGSSTYSGESNEHDETTD